MTQNQTNLERNPQIDRWHYLDFRDGTHDRNYIEWKYFNFVQGDLAGYFLYYVIDPEKQTKFGGGRLLGRIFRQSKSVGSMIRIDTGRIQFDPVSASVIMDTASITETSPFEYDIVGNLETLQWQLSYRQKAPTVESFSNIHSGLMRWEKLSWLIKMPQAQVRGHIQIDEETIAINALGYSDTNWGEILPFSSHYEWGQYNDREFSLVFAILYSRQSGTKNWLYFTEGGRMVALEQVHYETKHLEWTKDESTGLRIPKHSTFVFKNQDYTVRFSCDLVKADALGIKLSPLLPKPFISEQLVVYEGTIEKQGILVRKFQGRGFKEWSTKTYRQPPLLF